MDFLKPLFDEELNSEGAIQIGRSSFERSKILCELEPETYKLSFAEWLDKRKSELIEKADVILEQYDNANRFEQLKRSYSSGRTIPFVGAGMSMACGYPGWSEFLNQICVESHVASKDLNGLLNKGKYEEAAQLLYDDLGSGLFNENLDAAFSSEKEISVLALYLPTVFSTASVITTNFDKIIERVYGSTDNGFSEIKSGNALNEVLRLIGNGSRILLKLHGECNQVADRVLLKSEYDNAYSDKRVVNNFFSHFLFGNTLLFIGCSLSTDRTIKSMMKVVKTIGAERLPRHYAFLELKTGDDRVERKKYLSLANIFPIWYGENEHEESIEALFLKLMEQN